MCGRYVLSEELDLSIYEKILADKFSQETLKLWKRTGEFFPSDIILTIDNKNEITLMKWGYELFNRKVINTRIESIRDKRIYTSDFKNNRCLIPASGFFEWDSQKNKCYFHTEDNIIYLAGIYQNNETINNCSILTKEATSTSNIHDRIPIVLDRKQAANYLNKADLASLFNNAPVFTIERP